jgi:hypothetical protein
MNINYDDEYDHPNLDVNQINVVNNDNEVVKVNSINNMVNNEDAKNIDVIKEVQGINLKVTNVDTNAKKVNKEEKDINQTAKKPDSSQIQPPITKVASPFINSQVNKLRL